MQANNSNTALCPGMQCRTAYDNFLDECGDVPGVASSVRQALDAFDEVGK